MTMNEQPSNEANTESTVAENTTTEQASVETTSQANLLDHISEDLRGQANLNDFKDVNDLAKSYVNLQRMVGNSVRIPAADATEEARQEFLDKVKDVDGILLKNDEGLYNKLGRPEAADGYTLDEVVNQEMVNKVPGLNEEVNDFKTFAHEIGLTNEQAQKLVQYQVGNIENAVQDQEQAVADAQASLQKLWGQEYNNRLAAAKQMASIMREKHGDAVDALINSSAGNNPVVLDMLSEMAQTYKEKGHAGVQQTAFGMTPDMALGKIAEKKADIGFHKALYDDTHPGHKKAVDELTKLYAIANGVQQ